MLFRSILSGLSEDDLIAFPMEGLYEGIKTVTDESEIDYSSGLYNNGTEEMGDDMGWNEFDSTESGYDEDDYDDEDADDGNDLDGIDQNRNGKIDLNEFLRVEGIL